MAGINPQELKNLFLFQLLTNDELEETAGYFEEKSYLSGATIFKQREKGESMHVVKRGEVKIMRTELEHEKELALMHAGDFFGEVTLFDYALRTAAALTVQDTVLLEISRNNFNRLFKNNPRIVAKLLYQMMTEMSRRLRRRNNPGGGLIL